MVIQVLHVHLPHSMHTLEHMYMTCMCCPTRYLPLFTKSQHTDRIVRFLVRISPSNNLYQKAGAREDKAAAVPAIASCSSGRCLHELRTVSIWEHGSL